MTDPKEMTVAGATLHKALRHRRAAAAGQRRPICHPERSEGSVHSSAHGFGTRARDYPIALAWRAPYSVSPFAKWFPSRR